MILVVLLGWFITDKLIEPRLSRTEIDGDPEEMPKMPELTAADKRGMWAGLISVFICLVLLGLWMFPAESALRAPDGKLTSYKVSSIELGFGITTDPESGQQIVGSVPPAGLSSLEIKPGDKVVKIGDFEISDAESVKNALGEIEPGSSVPVVLERAGEDGQKDIINLEVKTAKKNLPGAPLMNAIVPLIFILFVIPGIVHGYVSGTFSNHRDVIKGMSKSMETMAYYLVLVFFVALFIQAFKDSHLANLLAIKGAAAILESGAPAWLVIIGLILLTAFVNLFVGSASAKWTMLAPIFVPMLMYAGMAPELTQAAYRVGDSTTNIITPMMPYFPLVVVFSQRYVKKTGIGTVAAMMLPYSVCFLVLWSLFLIIYWQLGLPLGIDAPYEYLPANAGGPS